MAPSKKIRPFGAWESSISPARLAAKSLRLSEPALDGGNAYWLEGRPTEKGCNVLVTRDAAGVRDLTSAPFDVRSSAGAYGGGACVVSGGRAFFVNAADRRLYALEQGGSPRAITPKSDRRFADLKRDDRRGRFVAVCERVKDRHSEPRSSLVAVGDDGQVTDLYDGPDFIASPALGPRADSLAWIEWNNPKMPWDGCGLMLATLSESGAIHDPRVIAGSDRESIFQPSFAPDGTLWFVSDRSGWWNLYRYDGNEVIAAAAMNAEFGQPQWVFGMSTYGFGPGGALYGAYCRDGSWSLYRLDPKSGAFEDLGAGLTAIDAVAVSEHAMLVAGASPQSGDAIRLLDFESGAWSKLRSAGAEEPDAAGVSLPEALSLEGKGGRRIHGFFYPPANAGFEGPAGERPPLIVRAHGGPTALADSRYDLRTQFWTSRGFAVFDVNYRGSTGFGREFRQSLLGGWGRYDADDAVEAAQWLCDSGRADGNRLAISGRSAGGLTVLSALINHRVFNAGASYYGVTDLKLLFEHTHRFERYYTLRMLGIDEPDDERFNAVSPAHHADRLSRPVIFFQGMKDEVVPPEQTEKMIAAMKKNGVPYAYLSFADEKHGFRRAETIEQVFAAELGFFARVLNLQLPQMPTVHIHGMDDA